MRRLTGRVFVLAVALALTAVGPLGAQEQPKTGGVLKAAMIGEPPTLDLHTTTAVLVQHITWHVYETLYTYDRNYNADPAAGREPHGQRRGRTYTFKLRQGVKFHNGKEMTSADVVASLTRWGRLATPGKQFWKNVEGIEAKDPYTVAMYLKDTSGALLMGLARPNNGAVIYPKEIVDAAGDNQVKEFIGTGPYRFVEHKPDRHVKVARFKDYAARAGRARRLRRQAHGLPRRDPLHPGARRRRAAGRGRDRRVPLQPAAPAGPVRPDQDASRAWSPSIIKPADWSTAVLEPQAGR